MRIAFHLLLVCLLLAVTPAIAADFPVRYLGIENGLSNNAVIHIYQDARGFMWFGTYDGLNRYDGYKFKVFRNHIGDSSSLADNSIYYIEGADDNRLWIGGRKGISIFNPLNETFSPAFYTPHAGTRPQKLNGNIHVIQALTGGPVLVGSEGDGLLAFDAGGSKGRQVPLQQTTAYEVTAIEQDGDNHYAWVFVQNKGLCRYSVAGNRLQLLNNQLVKANYLKLDRQGNLWVGAEDGLYRYDIATNRFSANYTPGYGKIVNLCEDRQGVLWIASDGNGILLLNPGQTQAAPLQFSGSSEGLSSNSVYSICEDREGRKWIGTLRGGINIIEARRNAFELHRFSTNAPRGRINNFIFSFGEDEPGYIWVGTDGAGLKYWNRKTNEVITYTHDSANASAISSNFVTSILRDSYGRTWVGTWFGGINLYNRATHGFRHFSCFNTATQAEERNVWLLYEDRQRRLWASTTNNGTLYLFNNTNNRFELFDPQLVNMQCLAEDHTGAFWGGNYTSLVKIDRENKKHRVYPLGYTIRCIREDRQGNFWIGTDGGGLLLFNRSDGSFTRYTDAHGLPSNSILRLLEDNKGNLWMSTFNGLACFDTHTRTARAFSQSDGLQSNQFAYKAAGELRSGEFIFGGIKGFNIFYPDSVYAGTAAPPLYLTAVRVNNQPLEQNNSWITGKTTGAVLQIKVPYDKAALSLDYTALEYTSPDRISYAYFLEGWDKSWNYVGEARTANYTRLQEGHYIFKIRATNAQGVWGAEVSTISIIVLPPWYRSWWAYLLYGLVIVSAFYVYISYTGRQQRLQYEIQLARLANEKEKELHEKKLSFFTHVSHEFRTPLTLIINPVKELLQGKEPAPEQKTLNTIYRNARRLLSLVDQLLLFRKADTEGDRLHLSRLDMVQLCNEVFLCFAQQAKAKHIDYRFTAGSEKIELWADAEKMEIALFNLLSNAFKFSPEGSSIECSVKESGQEVLITVSDTGYGIPPDAGDRIFEKFRQAGTANAATGFGIGLFLVKQFVEKHGGSIRYTSRLQEGSRFTISLPAARVSAGPAPVPVTPAARHALFEELMEGEASLEEASPALLPADAASAEEMVTGKKSILLIDDDTDTRQYLRQLFTDQFIVYEAANGQEGMEGVARYLPDLVISDIQMQGMNGLELCRQIKQTDTLCHIPVILLTASASADTRLQGIEDGADDYITKPFEKDFLLGKVNNIIRSRNVLQQYFLDRITLQQTHIRVPAEYQEFLKRCIEIVEENLDTDDFTIKKFAQAIGMSHSALYKKVKSVSGQTVNAFIRSIRLRRAAVLMLQENLTINQAAFQVGIGDSKYFREQFCKLFGMNPSEYIKKYRHSFNREYNVVK